MIELYPPEVEIAYQEIAGQALGRMGQAVLGTEPSEITAGMSESEQVREVGMKNLREDMLSSEAAAREVVSFVLAGLKPPTDSSLGIFGLRVSHRWQHSIEGKDTEFDMLNEGTIGTAVGKHPNSEERGPAFVADVTLRLSQLLTPELVELVTSDQDRVTPVIMTRTIRVLDGVVMTREAVNG